MSFKPLLYTTFLLLLPCFYASGQTKPDFMKRHSAWTIENSPDSLHLLNMDTLKLSSNDFFSKNSYIDFIYANNDSNAFSVGANFYTDSTLTDEKGNKIPPIITPRYFKYGHWSYNEKANMFFLHILNARPVTFIIKDVDNSQVLLIRTKWVMK